LILVLHHKHQILEEAQTKVDNLLKHFTPPLITQQQRYQTLISIWSSPKHLIQPKLIKSFIHPKPTPFSSSNPSKQPSSPTSPSFKTTYIKSHPS
ncbi:hypothetical protein, partial [Bacillus velezensis]|uniref:hypothetical protein n=1 Tax=Bacillus velezensis TaxID=492670 RepID=UPI001C92C0FF